MRDYNLCFSKEIKKQLDNFPYSPALSGAPKGAIVYHISSVIRPFFLPELSQNLDPLYKTFHLIRHI